MEGPRAGEDAVGPGGEGGKWSEEGIDEESDSREETRPDAVAAAAWNESPEVVQALLDAGVDATAKNFSGETAWDLIQENEALQGTNGYQRLNELNAA